MSIERGRDETEKPKERTPKAERITLLPAEPKWSYMDGHPPFTPLLKHYSHWYEQEQKTKDFVNLKKEDHPDGIAILGQEDYDESYSDSNRVGFIKEKGRIRFSRIISKARATVTDDLVKSARFVDYDPRPGRQELNLQYYLSKQKDRVVLSIDIDDIYKTEFSETKVNLDKVLRESKAASGSKPLLPTLEETVKAAKGKNLNDVMAAKVPVIDKAGKESTRWHLILGFDAPKTEHFDPATPWTQSNEAIVDLLSHETTVKAVHTMDKVAWAIAGELRTYTQRKIITGITQRTLKAGIGVLIGAIMDTGSDRGDSGDTGVSGLDTTAENNPVSQFGQEYASSIGDPQFGDSVRGYSSTQGGMVTVNFPPGSDYGTDAEGNRYSRNQWGTIREI